MNSDCCKHKATLGPRPNLLDSREVRFLNRVIRWIVPPFGKAPERIELEADPRHAELLIPNSGLQSNSKGVTIPRERQKDSASTVPLSPQDATSYRSNVMRLAYLAADRVELQFPSKESARAMAGPATADVEALKKCIRFLLKYPRCIQSFERQDIVPKQINHLLQCLKLRWLLARPQHHEFLQNIQWVKSAEVYINNTGSCESLECRS